MSSISSKATNSTKVSNSSELLARNEGNDASIGDDKITLLPQLLTNNNNNNNNNTNTNTTTTTTTNANTNANATTSSQTSSNGGQKKVYNTNANNTGNTSDPLTQLSSLSLASSSHGQTQIQQLQQPTSMKATNTNKSTKALTDEQREFEERQKILQESQTNLIINYIPPNMNEGALGALFSPYGTMQNIKIVVDPHTGRSRGYGFVKYESEESAIRAQRALNGYIVGGKKLKVAYSRPQSKEIQNSNLYVTNIPLGWNNKRLGEVFKPYGYVIESRILIEPDGKSKGVGFVRLDNHTNALKAIAATHGYRVDENNELVVKLAQRKNQNRRSGANAGGNNTTQVDNAQGNKMFSNVARRPGETFINQGDNGNNFSSGTNPMLSEFYNKQNLLNPSQQFYRPRNNPLTDISANQPEDFYPLAYDPYQQPMPTYYGQSAVGSGEIRNMEMETNANVSGGVMNASLAGSTGRPYSGQSYNVVVRNLPDHYNVDHLIKLYAPYGPIQSVQIEKPTRTTTAVSNSSQPYGVVSYFFADDAKNAAEQTHHRQEGNRHLDVTWQ